MVQGGLPVGSSVVLQGPPGQEKLRFALTFLAEGLKSGGSGLVVTASQSPDAVIAELRELGVNLESVTNESRLRVIDWYSWSEETVQDIEDRGIVIRSSIDLTNLGVALSRAIAGLTGGGLRRAVIELLSPATSSYEVTQVYAFAQSAKRKFDRHQFTSLVLIEKEMHSGAQLTTLHQPFDGVIEIERTRSGGRIVRKIGVLHLKDTSPDPTFRLLEISDGGMRVVPDTPKPATPGATTRGSVLESQDERAQRLRLILQIATERLKLNPGDADALFAMAAAQATLDDAKGGLETLDRLAALDSAYPGLWVLKTKLHAKLGQADLARQSRMRAQQSEPEAAKTIDATVPCPMCEEPVALDATSCANCGVKFTPTRSMEEELDDLGHAAIQEMVQEELGPVKEPEKALDKPDIRAPKPEMERDVPPAKKPIEKTPSKRGLTNGLALGRRGASKAGRTNGLRGRTNGLRGRTNGLTNGLGRTNGLTNGLGRTNGLTNGLGRTNGLTNGLGRTNGLTNGLGGFRSSGFRPAGVRRMMQNAGWKLYLIPLVSVALLLAPLLFVPDYRGPAYPIRIDGQFGDWASQPTEAMGPGAALNPNIDVVRFGMVSNLGPYAFYVQVAGSALAGGGPSPGTMDTVRIFVDIDASSATGYRIDGLGADRLIEISGHGGTVLASSLWEFDSNRDQRDWNGWIKGTATQAAASGSQIEAEAEWLSSSATTVPVIATVHTESWDGQTDSGDFPVSPTAGTLSVIADPEVPDILSGNGVPLLQLTLTSHGQAVALDSLHIKLAGSAAPSAALSLRLMDGGTLVAIATPTSRDVTFSFPVRTIAVGATTCLYIVGDFSGTSGDTFGVRLPSTHPFVLGAGVVSLRENPGARMLGYLGSVPSTPRVDGAFDEWNALSSDTTNDVGPRSNPDIDLGRYGAQRNGTSTFLYADVTGRLFHGTPVPEHPQPVPAQSQGPADTDRDGVPDAVDPFPFDFNNDGIPDAQTNGDYDGDGITDYGFPGGTDYWLNTTIPSTFPAPYAGRSMSVYIGPDNRPPVPGDDAIRIFLDIDNSTFSGYSIGGIGADRLVEIRGKDGTVTQSALLAFTGSFPGQWAWTPLAPVTVALGYHAVELSVPLNASNLYVESGDFWGSVDSTTVVPAFALLTSSFKVSSANTPLSVPWQQAGPQPTAVSIDPNSNAATTVYNQQRKVVRAGAGAGETPCDATNSAGCWYTVFYDQLVEQATTAPSTETITLGTKVSGTFPTDISSEDGVYVQYHESTTTSEAAIAYRSNTGTSTVSSPKTRSWDGSSWGSEAEASTAGSPIRAIRVAPSPMSSSWRIIVTESDDGWLDAYVCTPTFTVTNNIGQVWSTAPGTPERRFDVAYENTSGDALLVYGVLSTDPTHDIAYRTYSGGSWGAEQYLDDTGRGTDVQYTQIDLAPKKGSDIIGMIGGDDTFDEANAWIWDGSAWGSYTQITGTMQSPNYRQVALAWESSSGNLLAVAALATSNDIISKEYSTSWSGTSQFTCAGGNGPTKQTFWISLKANPLPTANDAVLGLVQENYDLNTCYWTGSAWANWVQHDTDYDAVQTRAFDFAWENSGSKGLLVWGTSRTTGGGQITYKTFTAPNTWGPQTTAAMGSGFDQWVELRTNPFSGTVKILGAVLDSNRLLGAMKWDGSTFTVIGSSTFSANTGIASYESFDLRYRATIDGRLSVKYDFASVPAGDAYTLKVKGYRGDENVNIEVLTPPSSWNTRITVASTTNTMYTYDLTVSEYNSGAPSIRFVDALGSDAIASDVFVDLSVIVSTTLWDRVILMRSLDTSGSTWGAQVILASGRLADSPLVLTRDSAEPSIAIDSSGYLHVVWVSASAAGDQSTLNLVRYTRTTVAYPTQSQLATGGNWQAVTSVDDTSPGYMPTISTDTGGYPHIAWSQSKTVAPEAAGVAYRSNTGTDGVNSLKTRSWDGSAWGPEVEQTNAGSPVRVVRSARSPIDPDTSIVVTQGDDQWIDAYVCTPSCTVTSNVGQAGTVFLHPFDVAFEQSSGDALLAWAGSDFNNTHDIGYMTYTGGAWSPVQWYDDTTDTNSGPYGLVELAPKKGSDQIGLVGGDVGQQDITALIWDGSAFTNFVEVNTGSNTPGYENAAIAWESNSGHLLVVSADASSTTCRYMVYTTSWQPASTFTCGGTSTIRYLNLKANPVSTANDMVLSVSDLGSELSTVYWTGSAWNARVSQDPGLDEIDIRSFDFAWEATGSKGLLVYATTAGQLDSKKFTAPSTWTSLPSVGAGANIHRWVQARTNPNPAGAVKILGDVWENTVNDLGAWSWDGSTLTMISTTAFTADTGTNTVREAYDLEYRPVIGGYVYYKNQAGGGWKATVSWGVTYTGLSVDVSPQNNYVSLARYSAQSPGTGETQYTVCRDLLNTSCDAASEFTKWDGTSGFDTIAVGVETGSYPSLATTWDPNADLWSP